MKLFDIFGAASVVAWFGVIGYFVYDQYVAPQSRDLEAGAVFREGESYMLLTREDTEVGYLHEARTEVPETDSWLLEYDLVMNVSMLGLDQYLRTQIKATVDRSAYLQDFNATIESAGARFDITGEVAGNVVTMSMDLGGEPRTERIDLTEPPRLSNSALNELVASDNLEPGATFEQQYFDPTRMGMTTMTFEYVGKRKTKEYGGGAEIDTFFFRQRVGGTELDVRVDKYGEVHLQEFPLRIVGARVPNTLGRARALALSEKFEEASGDESKELDLQAAVGLLQRGEFTNSGDDASKFRISSLPADAALQLASFQQRVLKKTETVVEIDTSERGDLAPGKPGADIDALTAGEGRIDADADAFGELLPKEAPASRTLRAEIIAKSVRTAMEPSRSEAADERSASELLAAGEGGVRDVNLVLVAALRHHGIPARFASGIKVGEGGEVAAHQWVQYWDGRYFVDIDPANNAMLPGRNQIQLFTHAAPEGPRLDALVGVIEVEEIQGAAAGAKPAPDADFN